MKFRLLILGFSLSFYSQAQTVTLKGVVRDSLQKPLGAASLVAIDKATEALESYTITGEDGVFALKLKQNTAYKIQVSALGLQTIKDSLKTQ